MDEGPAFMVGPYDWVDAAFTYDGRPAQAVRRLKYDRTTCLVPWMAATLRERFDEHDAASVFDVVVPVPLARRRRADRGFNQSELICQDLPTVQLGLIKRIRETPPQVNLDHGERRTNLRGAFVSGPEAAGKRVLLVDDVYTTGATAEACAVSLLDAGAAQVGILTFCRVKEPFGPGGTAQ